MNFQYSVRRALLVLLMLTVAACTTDKAKAVQAQAITAQSGGKVLDHLTLAIDRKVLYPVREPSVTGQLTLTAFYSDGSQRTLLPSEGEVKARTRSASGNVDVVAIEGDKVVPKEGGIATIEAAVVEAGKRFTATADVVVSPFYRDYHQTLVLKLFLGMEGEPVERLAQEPLFQKRHDVICTFEEALEVIRKTDNLTRGIPKIIYLVGWQRGGHDHRYPAWDEVNPRMKREQDATALDSLRWLIREARKFNTTVSLHINMVDAYKQSPLWDEYVAKDCFGKDESGQLLVAGIQVKGEDMYNVVYPREWEAGLAQRRIDGLIQMIPELKEGHTIHIDVFIAQRDGGKPISPWHDKPENGGLTPDKYVETQRKIFHYWRERGFDVTGEGIFWAHPPGEGFTGLQAMSWWYPGDPNYQMQIPEYLMARGRTDRGGDGDFRFGSSMHGEEIYIRDKDNLRGFLGMFCRTTLPWYYLSRLERERFENDVLYYSDGVVAGTEEGKRIIRKGDFVLREDDDLFVPALWNEKEIIAYSKPGYENKTWQLSDDWRDVKSVDLNRIALDGCVPLKTGVAVADGKLVLSLGKDEAVSIVPSGTPLNESRTDQKWCLGNEQLELRCRRHGSQVVADQLVNKVSRRTIPITEDDFSLGIEGRPPLRGADFTFEKATEEAIAGGRRLTFQLKNAEPGARLDVIYELGDRDFFVRRRLELMPIGPLALREVDMWRVGLDGKCSAQERCVPVYLQLGPEWKYTAKHQGFGFPVFMEDTFWGLEYPAGYNHYEKGLMTLRHYPGRTVAGRFVSKTAVLGVAEPGQVPLRFRQYLDSIIGARSTPPLFFAWVTWVTITPPSEANCVALLDDFRRELFEATGARLDALGVDDGWDKKDSFWDINTDRFPQGFEPLLAAMKPMNMGLGLWLSPCSGYDHANWLAATRGYKKNNWDWLMCMSDPNYRHDLVDVVTRLVEQYDIKYLKFDAFCAPCDAEHPHHLADNYAKEANTDAYLELLAAIRRTQPGVFINITTGTWASPWWLQYVDSVWDQAYDGWPPGIAPTPELSQSQSTDLDALFRKRCRENPWFPPEAFESCGVWTRNFDVLDERYMSLLNRGCRLNTFYLDPRKSTNPKRDWPFLGSAINWARHNGEVLRHIQMILGDPMQLEPYGYGHFHGDRGIVVARNPFVTPRMVTIKLDESSGWLRAEAEEHGRHPLVATIVYPRHQTFASLFHYGDELTVELSAYELLVIHVTPLEASDTALLDVRHEETERSGNRVSYTVHARPGKELVVPVAGATRLSEVRWNGRRVKPVATPTGIELPLVMEGTPQACQIEGGKLSERGTETGWKITGKCIATVPQGTPATMHLMWAHPEALHPPAPKLSDTSPGFQLTDDAGEKAALRQQAERLRAVRPRCSATVNGKPAKVAAYNSKLYRPENVGDHRTYAEYPPGPWVWFSFDLPPGRSEVAVALECPKGDSVAMKAETGWWVWAENPLQKGTLTLLYDGPLPAMSPEPLPMAVRQDRQRQIMTLHPVTAH